MFIVVLVYYNLQILCHMSNRVLIIILLYNYMLMELCYHKQLLLDLLADHEM